MTSPPTPTKTPRFTSPRRQPPRPPPTTTSFPSTAIGSKLVELLASSGVRPLAPGARRSLDRQVRILIRELEEALTHFDPVSMPTSVFDPSNPKIIGRFTALALVAQPLRPLASLGRFYGSGVYALYYTGDYPLYRRLSGSETPIYVGKAGPANQGALTARDQGERLAARLNDHRKNISKAVSTLAIADFHARPWSSNRVGRRRRRTI